MNVCSRLSTKRATLVWFRALGILSRARMCCKCGCRLSPRGISTICFRVSSTTVWIGAILIAVPSTRAESLTILNHSFENGVMDAANRYGTTSDWEVGGYDVSDAGVWIDDNLDANIYRPTTAEYTKPGVVPDGVKVAWVLGIADYDNGIRQILASNLAPNLTYNVNDQTSYTLSFNAGASANKLIVSAGSENGAAITGITYGGVAMTLIPNTGGGTDRNRGIWYLDNPFSTGTTNIVVSRDGVTSFTQMRLGVASIAEDSSVMEMISAGVPYKDRKVAILVRVTVKSGERFAEIEAEVLSSAVPLVGGLSASPGV